MGEQPTDSARVESPLLRSSTGSDPGPDASSRVSQDATQHPLPGLLVLREWTWTEGSSRYFRAGTHYVERLWLPLVGPTALLLLRYLAEILDEKGDGAQVEMSAIAVALGLGSHAQPGARSALGRGIRRLERFGFAQHVEDELKVRVEVPPVSERDLARLPRSLRVRHEHSLGQV